MIRYFSLGVLTVIVLFAGGAMLLPSGYDVKEHVFIHQPASKIYPYIDNLRNWNEWAFAEEEEGIRLMPEYKGPDEGTGATHTWMSSDGQSTAELRIISSNPYDNIQLQMSTNEGTFISDLNFHLEESDKGTLVTWEEKGDFGFQLVTRVIAFMSDYDKRVGDKYKAALEVLKHKLEEQNSNEGQ